MVKKTMMLNVSVINLSVTTEHKDTKTWMCTVYNHLVLINTGAKLNSSSYTRLEGDNEPDPNSE